MRASAEQSDRASSQIGGNLFAGTLSAAKRSTQVMKRGTVKPLISFKKATDNIQGWPMMCCPIFVIRIYLQISSKFYKFRHLPEFCWSGRIVVSQLSAFDGMELIGQMVDINSKVEKIL
jgi:hypothetical protein